MKSASKTNWAEIDALSDDEIDYSDIPEVTEEFFKTAFMRQPTHKKRPVSLRLDDDIIEFFKKTSKQYQTKINNVLRAYKVAYENIHHFK